MTTIQDIELLGGVKYIQNHVTKGSNKIFIQEEKQNCLSDIFALPEIIKPEITKDLDTLKLLPCKLRILYDHFSNHFIESEYLVDEVYQQRADTRKEQLALQKREPFYFGAYVELRPSLIGSILLSNFKWFSKEYQNKSSKLIEKLKTDSGLNDSEIKVLVNKLGQQYPHLVKNYKEDMIKKLRVSYINQVMADFCTRRGATTPLREKIATVYIANPLLHIYLESKLDVINKAFDSEFKRLTNESKKLEKKKNKTSNDRENIKILRQKANKIKTVSASFQIRIGTFKIPIYYELYDNLLKILKAVNRNDPKEIIKTVQGYCDNSGLLDSDRDRSNQRTTNTTIPVVNFAVDGITKVNSIRSSTLGKVWNRLRSGSDPKKIDKKLFRKVKVNFFASLKKRVEVDEDADFRRNQKGDEKEECLEEVFLDRLKNIFRFLLRDMVRIKDTEKFFGVKGDRGDTIKQKAESGRKEFQEICIENAVEDEYKDSLKRNLLNLLIEKIDIILNTLSRNYLKLDYKNRENLKVDVITRISNGKENTLRVFEVGISLTLILRKVLDSPGKDKIPKRKELLLLQREIQEKYAHTHWELLFISFHFSKFNYWMMYLFPHNSVNVHVIDILHKSFMSLDTSQQVEVESSLGKYLSIQDILEKGSRIKKKRVQLKDLKNERNRLSTADDSLGAHQLLCLYTIQNIIDCINLDAVREEKNFEIIKECLKQKLRIGYIK